MTKYFGCCESCFSDIARSNTSAARSWMDLCTLRLEKQSEVLLFKDPNVSDLRALEMLGFVVSTDHEDVVAVKMNGYYENQGEHYFCISGGRHE